MSDFLNKNSIGSTDTKLPYLHSTRSFNIEKIIQDNELSLSFCNDFGEDLIYFFRGRPAYKASSDGEEASYWQLPTCFIHDRLPRVKVERTFPFDSGAFKQGRYPDYIKLMPIDDFQVDGTDASDRIVEAFFGDINNYVLGGPKSESELTESYDISAFDAEVLAIRRLAADGTPKTFDDRRFTIEVQSSMPVDLQIDPPSAVILPLNYLEEERVQVALEKWHAQPITYDVHSQSLELYYGVIFQKFIDYLKQKSLLK